CIKWDGRVAAQRVRPGERIAPDGEFPAVDTVPGLEPADDSPQVAELISEHGAAEDQFSLRDGSAGAATVGRRSRLCLPGTANINQADSHAELEEDPEHFPPFLEESRLAGLRNH